MALGTFVEAQITNIRIKSDALLEIAAGMHSPFCPNLAEFSADVPPALQKGITSYFNIGDLGFFIFKSFIAELVYTSSLVSPTYGII